MPTDILQDLLPSVLIANFTQLLEGAAMTLGLTAAAVVPSALIGVILAVAWVFGGLILRALVDAFVVPVPDTVSPTAPIP